MYRRVITGSFHKLAISLLCLLLPQLAEAQSWAVLKAQADSLEKAEQVALAYTAYKRALSQAAVEFGNGRVQYGEALAKIGMLLVSKGQQKAAEDTLLLAQQLFEQAGPIADTLLGYNNEQLAACYRRQNKFAQAEPAYLRALTHWKKLLGRNSSRYAFMQVGLGNLYNTQSQPAKALPFFLAALAHQKQANDLTLTEYGVLLNGLATAYNALDQPDKAETLLLESIVVRRKANSATVASSANSLAILYEQMGESEKAMTQYWEALSVYGKQQLGSVEHATVLQNMALCASNMGRRAIADSLYEQTLAIYRQLGFTKSASYATTLHNQSLLRFLQERPAEAWALNTEARAIAAAVGSRRNVLYSRLLLAGGTYSMAQNALPRADSLFTMALALNDSLVGPLTMDHAQIVTARAFCWYRMGRFEQAIAGLDEGLTLYRQKVQRHFLYATPNQKEAYVTRWSAAHPLYNTIGQQHPANAHLAGEVYTGTLYLKNLLLNEQSQWMNTIRHSADSLTRSRLDSVQQMTRLIAQQYTLPTARRMNVDSLETKTERLEKELARQSAPFRATRQAIGTTWREVQRGLKPTEAAVEFVHFQYHNGRKVTDSTLYLALVLRPGWPAPHLVPLCHEKTLARLLITTPTQQLAARMPLRAKQQRLSNTFQLAQGALLYRLVWQPIDSLLRGVRQVWVSPSGLLHKVALAALPYPTRDGGQVLADHYALRQVSTTRALLSNQPTRWTATSRAQLYGGIAYGTDSLGRADWPTLPGTLREVQAIGQLLGPAATLVTGEQATRHHLMTQPATTVLHLATHGFFQSPDSTRTDFVRLAAERTMRRSGIALAGANRGDGMLLGPELASLPLTGTELVVLSGCETGLGDIRGSEGVFGLQRAVKMAGAKNLMLSLWPVPDGPASLFMTTFYRNWKQPGTTLHSAFAATQTQFRRQYPPAVWAAFVLIE